MERNRSGPTTLKLLEEKRGLRDFPQGFDSFFDIEQKSSILYS